MSAVSFVTIFMNVVVAALSLAALFLPMWTASFGGGAQTNVDISLWDMDASIEVAAASFSADSSVAWDDMCALTSQLPDDFAAKCDMVKATRATLILAAAFAVFSIAGVCSAIFADNNLILALAGTMASVSCLCNCVSIALVCAVGSDGLESPGFILMCISTFFSLLACILANVGFANELATLRALVKASGHKVVGKQDSKGKPVVGTRAQRAAKKRAEEHQEYLARQALASSVNQRNVLKDGIDLPPESQGGSRPGTQDSQDPGAEAAAPPAKGPPIYLQKVLFHQGRSDEDEIPLEDLEAAFREIDIDDGGSIDLDELVGALRQCGLEASQAATDTIMKEIDKNASGDVDIHEFIEFFRHIEELDRFEKKSAARQQFLTFLLNFCFLADIIVVGVMLMLFIKMDKDESPDDYSIMKNVLIACSVVLGILFICVICVPILQLSLGPSIGRAADQYELSKQLKQQARKFGNQDGGGGGGSSTTQGPRGAAAAWTGGGTAAVPAIDNAEYMKKSYRVNVRTNELMNSPHGMMHDDRQMALRDLDRSSASVVRASRTSELGGQTHERRSKSSRRQFQYTPDQYKIAEGYAMGQHMPTSFSPMQVRDLSVQNNQSSNLPGAPPALADAPFPMY